MRREWNEELRREAGSLYWKPGGRRQRAPSQGRNTGCGCRHGRLLAGPASAELEISGWLGVHPKEIPVGPQVITLVDFTRWFKTSTPFVLLSLAELPSLKLTLHSSAAGKPLTWATIRWI
jgi:hypothetical protein